MHPLVQFPRTDGSRTPYKVFSSDEVYALEQERIFRGPVWSFLALEAEIPNNGDFKSTFIGDTPVVVTRTEDGTPMALEHVSRLLFGVQFHPESILTEAGHRLLGNFLTLAGLRIAQAPAGDRTSDANALLDPADVWWQTEPL